MSRRIDFLGSVCKIIGAIFGALGYVFRFVRLMLEPKAVLAAKLVATESQLAACVDAVSRKKTPKPKFTLSTRPWMTSGANRRGTSSPSAANFAMR